MPSTRVISTISAVSCVLAVTSCGVGNVLDSSPGTFETNAPDRSDPSLKIEKPKDLRGISDACTILKPDQLAELRQDDHAPESTTSASGQPYCRWSGDNYSAAIHLSAFEDIGPAEINKNLESSNNSRPIKIDGYPGVQLYDHGTRCDMEIGVADNQHFAVFYFKNHGRGPEFDNGCEYAKKIAAEALRNIPDA